MLWKSKETKHYIDKYQLCIMPTATPMRKRFLNSTNIYRIPTTYSLYQEQPLLLLIPSLKQSQLENQENQILQSFLEVKVPLLCISSKGSGGEHDNPMIPLLKCHLDKHILHLCDLKKGFAYRPKNTRVDLWYDPLGTK